MCDHELVVHTCPPQIFMCIRAPGELIENADPDEA